MADQEALVLDGLAVNDGVTLGMLSLSAPPPRQRQDWIGAADSEDQKLVRNPLHENRTITARIGVVPQASMDVAHDKLLLVLDKLQKASKYPDGIALTWTPATSSRTVTFDVLAGEITDLPVDWENGWLAFAPEFTIELTCKPYWRGTPLATVTDAFAANSIADYTFDAGIATNVLITGGVMDAVANLTTENRMLHTASPYTVANTRVTAKHTLGTTLSSYKAGVILKRVDASNYLEVYVDDTGAASRLRVDRVIAGSRTNLASTALTRMTVSTAYWVRARLEGNVVFAEHWTSAPTVTGSATSTGTATLAGGDATTLGVGVAGRAGLVWLPQQTAATLDDFELAPNMAVASEPFVDLDVPNVPGDIAGLGTIIVTDSAAQSRRHVEWGLEGPLTYSASTSLLVDSDSMVTSGFAGSQVTTSGAYDPNASGNNSISVSLFANAQTAVCGTGNLSHVGVFRVKARVQFASDQDYARLSWRALDGPTSANDWVFQRSAPGWEEIDLGTITIPVASSGTQRWTGQIEALTTRPGGSSIIVDYLELIPAGDGYGKARASYRYQPGVVVGQDAFIGTTSASALNTRVAPAGGTWATSGDTTDFVFDDNMNPSGDGIESIIRSTTASESSGRFAILGSTSYTDTQLDVRIRASNLDGGWLAGLIARWTDSSNYLRLTTFFSSPTTHLKIEQVVGGVVTTIAETTWPLGAAVIYRCRLLVYASGRVIAQAMNDSGSVLAQTEGYSTALATGGTLQTGKPGILDRRIATTVATRRYTGFVVSVPTAEPIAVYGGREMQIRYDDVFRQDSAGTYVGQPPSYRGSRFLAPVGTSRVLVKARRNDIESAADDTVTDSTTIQIVWTPRGLAVPRS